MFNPLKSLGDLKSMRDQALKIQQALSQEQVSVEMGDVRVVMTGDQKILELTVNGTAVPQIQEAISEAIKKSQEVAAHKLQEMSGGLGSLGSLLGR